MEQCNAEHPTLYVEGTKRHARCTQLKGHAGRHQTEAVVTWPATEFVLI